MAIFGPVLATMALTLVVWVYMYTKRIPFILRAQLEDSEMTPLGFMQRSPPDVANPSDNLKNLFELPVVFYALCVYLYVTDQVDEVYVVAAWIFFAFRVLHSIMHCTRNIVIVRFWLYAISSVAVWFMLARAVISYLQG